MTAPHFERRSLTLILTATVAALIARAVLRLSLERRGVDSRVAADLSYLVVPPVLLLLTVPIWPKARVYITTLYRRADLSLRVVISAIAVGVLLRLAWWAATIARVSFGWFTDPAVGETVGPAFVWQCPPPLFLALGVLVMAVLVPVVEEIVHRGYVFGAASRWGVPVALVISSLVFMLLHRASSWPAVFIAGLIFAVQFNRSGSLWTSTIAHSTYNLLVQFDWRCLRGRWYLAENEVPHTNAGVLSLAVLTSAALGILFLIMRMPGAKLHSGR